MSTEISRRTFYFSIAAILLLALLAREYFALTALFPNPTQGDVSSYLRYALHLMWDGTFSKAEQGQAVVPDTFRTPGYPVFLAAIYIVAGAKLWFPAIYQAQILLGVGTVLNTIVIARLMIGRAVALVAGLWMALEPHNITANSTIMTETCLGFLMTSGLLWTLIVPLKRSTWWAALSGAFLAAGCLVNPVVMLFPPVLLLIYLRERLLLAGLLMLMIPFLTMAAWDARGALLHLNTSEMAERTLAFGSWPELFDAWRNQFVDPHAQATYQHIVDDVNTMVSTPAIGIAEMTERMRREPIRYLSWYVLQKPFLLWDWNLQLGAGGVNYLDTLNSPLEKNPLLNAAAQFLRFVNPLAFFLALAAALFRLKDRPSAPAAALFLYVTVIYSIFQAEPRYSTPFRSMEIVLALAAIVDVFAFVQRTAQMRSATSPDT